MKTLERTRLKQSDYELLVRRAADGQHGDADLADRDPADFQRDVDRLQARRRAAADLEKIKTDERQLAALTAEAAAAKTAFDNLPIVKMLRQMHEAQASATALREESLALKARISQSRSTATHVLTSTGRQDRWAELRSIQGQIASLTDDRKKLALSDAEAREYAAALDLVATNPPVHLGTSRKSKSSDTERVCSLTLQSSQLTAAKAVVKRCAERIGEAEKLSRQIAVLEAKKVPVADTVLDPEAMQFISQPAPRSPY